MRRRILPVADMEATPPIRFLFALGAAWKYGMSTGMIVPRAYAVLCHAMRGNECRFPLDPRPALGAVHVLVSIFDAGGHQE